jgi:hypothetical protein
MMNFKHPSRLFYPLLIVLLAGCSNPFATHYTNIKLAIALNEDVTISLEEVKSSQVELALIKSGDRPVALIAKAFHENDQDKWISNDRAMLVIKHGRVIRTIGFKNDQLGQFTGSEDPLSDVSSIHNKTWMQLIDWSVGEYGNQTDSHFTLGQQSISILGNNFEALHVLEKVKQTQQGSLFLQDAAWYNEYWFDKASGKLLETHLQASSVSDRFEIQFVSNAASLIGD